MVTARSIEGDRVRRWWVALVCAAALGLMSACGSLPYGIDGDVTDEWTLPGEPQPFEPAATGCFDAVKLTAPLATYAPFDCAQRHTAEAYYLGELTGKAAAKDANRGEDGVTPAHVAAYAECARRAVGFLGADHRTGLTRIQPVLPGTAGWQSGARWFRCDLIEVDATNDRITSRSGSLRDALKGDGPVALRCFRPTVSGEKITGMAPIGCAKPHNAEFAGLWTAPDSSFERLDDKRVAKGCRSTIADWAKVPDDGNVQYRLGYLSFAPNRNEWDHGVRTVQCFLWVERAMTGSYRGAGTKKLPINYG